MVCKMKKVLQTFSLWALGTLANSEQQTSATNSIGEIGKHSFGGRIGNLKGLAFFKLEIHSLYPPLISDNIHLNLEKENHTLSFKAEKS